MTMRMFGLVVAALAVLDVVIAKKTISTADMQLRTELLQSVRDVVGNNRIPDVVQTRIGDIKHAFAPTFATINKNSKGNLDDDEVDYLLQRFFSQHHGWTFAPFGQGSLALVHEIFKADREDGFTAHDVAMMAAVIEHTVKRFDLADVSMVQRHHDDCMSKEGVLFDVEEEQRGRVALTDFYHVALNEQVTLVPDSIQTLRANGVLDESDASNPKMIIPNYMASSSNCISRSSFFSICCPDGCLEILSYIETALGRSDATTEDLVSVVENSPIQFTGLADGFVPLHLVRKLRDIAGLHAGRVPLHGEAFAQWLHVVSPQMCTLPQRGPITQSKDTLDSHRVAVNGKLAVEEDLFVTRYSVDKETIDDLTVGVGLEASAPVYTICGIVGMALFVVLARISVMPSKKMA